MKTRDLQKVSGFLIVIGSLTYWFPWRGVRAVYGAGLENQWTLWVPWVRIPPSPQMIKHRFIAEEIQRKFATAKPKVGDLKKSLSPLKQQAKQFEGVGFPTRTGWC